MTKLTFDELSITSDFDRWYSNNKTYVLEILGLGQKLLGNKYINPVPENLDEELLEYGNQLKDYVDGFLLKPVCMYEETPVYAKTIATNTFDEIIEFMKELRENNKLVFLYMVYKIDVEPTEDDTVQEPYSLYKLRYGVLND